MLKPAWIRSPSFDLIFILLPPFYGMLWTAAAHQFDPEGSSIFSGILTFLIASVFIDWAHTFSTIYRYPKARALAYGAPIVSLILCVATFQISELFMYRFLAYFAVYHFARQAYGIMRYYDRGRPASVIDQIAIYATIVYPVLINHLHSPKNMGWFVQGDFVSLSEYKALIPFVHVLAAMIALAYINQERKKEMFNAPKNLAVIGPVLANFLGFVIWDDGSAIGPITNIGHGLPYMAMIWAFNGRDFFEKKLPEVTRFAGPVIFCMSVVILGYLGAAMEDSFLESVYPEAFQWLHSWHDLRDHSIAQVMTPILAMFTLTHFIVDGFIWKMKGKMKPVVVDDSNFILDSNDSDVPQRKSA
jgi:hypothetical protein